MRKFTQTNNSLAMMPLLVDGLGFLGNTPQCDLILQGKYYPPDSIDRYSKTFIQALARPTLLENKPSASISTEIFCDG